MSTIVNRRFALAAVICLTLGGWPHQASAQVIVPILPKNLVSVTVSANVTFDSAFDLYTYQYEVSSDASSVQEVDHFLVQFVGSVQDVSAPLHWMGSKIMGRSIVSWGVIDVGTLPPDYVDDGNLPPSQFTIKPGQRLSGFAFRSPDPPATSHYFAQGFTKLPQVTKSEDELPGEQPDFTVDSASGLTVAPMPIDPAAMFNGGRRPSVDTFLVFLNVTDGATLQAPFTIVIKFGPNGEQVNRSTFRATLNQVDVTAAFQPGGAPGDLVAIFSLGASPLNMLRAGRNVLFTTVDGIVPGTTRTGSAVDRLTFYVQ